MIEPTKQKCSTCDFESYGMTQLDDGTPFCPHCRRHLIHVLVSRGLVVRNPIFFSLLLAIEKEKRIFGGPEGHGYVGFEHNGSWVTRIQTWQDHIIAIHGKENCFWP